MLGADNNPKMDSSSDRLQANAESLEINWSSSQMALSMTDLTASGYLVHILPEMSSLQLSIAW